MAEFMHLVTMYGPTLRAPDTERSTG